MSKCTTPPAGTTLYDGTFLDGVPWHWVLSQLKDSPEARPISDEAYRTYLEINVISHRWGFDGKVPMGYVKALCVSPKLEAALVELSSSDDPYLETDGDFVTIRGR